MARPTRELPSPSALVPIIVRDAAARGLDVDAWRWRFDLPADASERAEVLVGTDVPEQLLEAVEHATGETDAALRLAARLDGRANRLVEIAVRSSANVGAALAVLSRAAPLVHRGFEGGVTGLGFKLATPRRPRGVGGRVHTLAVAYAVLQLRSSLPAIQIEEAHFAHARPAHVDALRALLGTATIRFGCEDTGFALAEGDLERAMPGADARTLETMEALVAEALGTSSAGASFAERIVDHVASALPEGTELPEVARAMKMSSRTLQRRLEQEGTHFSEVLDRARLAVAQAELARSATTLTELAFRLGFADLATFTRAFKRWTGMPPGQWRQS